MGTIADKLAYLQGTKEDIAAAITAKGGTVTTADTFRSYGDKIRAIEGGGDPDTWQPRRDWWDIEKVLEEDTQVGYAAKYIVLLADTQPTILLRSINAIGGNAWKTSDGQFYTSGTTHTWDTTKDKPCALGYKTRWLIVYFNDVNIEPPTGSTPVLWAIFGSCHLTSLRFGSQSEISKNRILQAVDASAATMDSAALVAYSGFYGCSSLQHVRWPTGIERIAGNVFSGCGLSTFAVPEGVTYCHGNTVGGCPNLTTIVLPSTITETPGDLGSGSYAITTIVLPEGFDASLTLNNSTAQRGGLSVSSMLDMFSKLKDNTGETAKTLTLGTPNLDKLTAEEKAIATNKNWTLA